MPDSTPTPTRRQSAWSRYWRHDVLHSLPGSFAGNYEGAIGDFWQRQFEPLLADHRVLDIGTGNGALAQLACHVCAATMPRVDAIDLAEIAPDWISAQPLACQQALHFHSGVSAEALPFPAHSFDLAVSQYGLEYCNAALAIAQLARVLTPGGRVALLMHHRDSRLTEVAREELRLAQWLLAPAGFVDRLEGIVPYIAQAASEAGRAGLRNNTAANAARDDFNRAMQALGAEAAASPFPDLLQEARTFSTQCLASLQNVDSMATTLQSCHDYRQSLHDAQLRYAELCECAMDDSAIAAFTAQLGANGFVSISHAPIAHGNGMLMGWTLTAQTSGT